MMKISFLAFCYPLLNCNFNQSNAILFTVIIILFAIVLTKASPPTFTTSCCDWLIKTIKDDKTMEITFLKNES